jgi:hypothetical protein
MRSFGAIDLDLSVEKVHVESSIDSEAAGLWVEDVANNLPVGEGMIGDTLLDPTRDLVRDRHK